MTREKSAAPSPSPNRETERWVLDNVYTIARREARRVEEGKPLRPEMWDHIMRLCEKVGAQSRTVGVLRDGSAAPSPSPEALWEKGYRDCLADVKRASEQHLYTNTKSGNRQAMLNIVERLELALPLPPRPPSPLKEKP